MSLPECVLVQIAHLCGSLYLYASVCVCVGNQVCHIPRSVIVTIAIGGTG